MSAMSSLASFLSSPLKGGGYADEAILSKAAADARIVPGDLLFGVIMASFFPLMGDSCSKSMESPLRNGGMKLGERNPVCLCEADVCEGAGLCDGVGDLGSPAMAPLILSNMISYYCLTRLINKISALSANKRKELDDTRTWKPDYRLM